MSSIRVAWTNLTVLTSILSAPLLSAAESPLVPVSPKELPTLSPDGDIPSFKTALRRQIDACASQNPKDRKKFGKRSVTRKVWCTETNQAFLDLIEKSGSFEAAFEAAKTRFEWYRSVGRDGKGEILFTAYHSPTLIVRSKPDERFKYPIYRKPADLVQVSEDGNRVWRRRLPNGKTVPYYTRKEIDSDGALRGRELEIAYADDLLSVSLLQIQGAGSLMLQEPDGRTQKVIANYSAQNGYKWVGIGKVLKDKGVEEKYLTIPGMREYFRLHPDELVPVLNQDPSYVFFQTSDEGPYGVNEILLSPGHSVAVDLGVFPVGAIAFFQTQRPVFDEHGQVEAWQPFSRFAVNQDTGGAIRGPGRIDIYWGENEAAESAAGVMRQTGSLYYAVLPEKR